MSAELQFETRADKGTAHSRRLRKSRRTPAIIYSKGDCTAISLDSHAVSMYFRDQHVFSRPLELQEGKNKARKVIVKAVERHPVTRTITHLDFQEVSAKSKVVMRVPVVFNGAELSPGVRSGGVVARQISDIELRGELSKIPEAIELDLSKMEARERVRLSEVKVPKGVEIMEVLRKHDHDVVSILARRGGSAGLEDDLDGPTPAAVEAGDEAATE